MRGNWNLMMSAYMVLLFVVLTPGVLVTLPSKGSLLSKAVVHGIIFAVVYHFTHRYMWKMTRQGFANAPPTVTPVSVPVAKLVPALGTAPTPLKEGFRR